MRRGPGTARDFSNGRPAARAGVRPGTAMDFSTAARSGQGVSVGYGRAQ